MAHHVRIKATPHTNKDGSPSKSKKDYTVTVRSRGKKRVLGVGSSMKQAQQIKEDYWGSLTVSRQLTGVK